MSSVGLVVWDAGGSKRATLKVASFFHATHIFEGIKLDANVW